MSSNDEEIKFLYLLSGSSDVLPSSCLKLRSYLKIHLSNLAREQNLQLLKSFRNRNKTCPYCFSPWSGDTTSFTLLPAKRFRTNKPRDKIDEERNGEKREVKESRNTLVLMCKVCRKKSSFSLVKKKFVDEEVPEDKVDCVKKKKKKRDKSCGLAINLIENESTPTDIVVKKNKRMAEPGKATPVNPAYLLSSGSVQSKVLQKHAPNPKSSVMSASKNLVPNPFAAQSQQGPSGGKKKNKKLERLKQAVKVEKSVAKKTLKDFLTLV